MVLCVLASLDIIAQENSQKQFLPKEGDWAIGVDVLPVINFIGNSFNGTIDQKIEGLAGAPITKGSNLFDNALMPDASIMFKYMLRDQIALKANVGMQFSNDWNRQYVQDDKAIALDPMSEEKLIDSKLTKTTGMSLSIGAEYRKGARRVQGIFGLSALAAFQNQTTSYNFGNGITSVNQRPSTAFPEAYTNDGYRIIKNGNTTSDAFIGLAGSVGLEWFVAPQIAIGSEVNLSFYYLFGKQKYTESEKFETSLEQIVNHTDITSPGNRGFYCGTETLGGSLYMIFYF